MQTRNKDGLAIICFNRAELLEGCIKSVLEASNSKGYTRILFQQGKDPSVSAVVEKYRLEFDHIFQVSREGNSTQNISKNRYFVYSFIFDHLDLDTATVLEDDVEITHDSLDFSHSAHQIYKDSRNYRAFNFGSGIPRTKGDRSEYSLVRYALQGPASLLPKSSWRHFSLDDLILKSDSEIFDGTLEPYMQTGFIIMPNSSRYRDLGRSGTHASPETHTEYFSKLENSWHGLGVLPPVMPSRRDQDQNWRADCVTYRSFYNPYYHIRAWAVFKSGKWPVRYCLLLFRKIKKTLF